MWPAAMRLRSDPRQHQGPQVLYRATRREAQKHSPAALFHQRAQLEQLPPQRAYLRILKLRPLQAAPYEAEQHERGRV